MSDMTEPKYLSPEWFASQADPVDIDLDTINKTQKWFDETYSIEKLKALQGKEVLTTLYGDGSGKLEHYLCYDLENNQEIRHWFGSISGGSAYKFGMFYNRGSGWKTGTPAKPVDLTESQAIDLAIKIRDELIGGAEEIAQSPVPQNTEDYVQLYQKVHSHIELNGIWKLKYYRMLFPDIFFSGYNDDIQRHVLYTLQIEPYENENDPHEGTFVRMGQIALFAKECGISCVVFGHLFAQKFDWRISIYRIGTGGDDGDERVKEWIEQKFCALGWDKLGDLKVYSDDKGALDKQKLMEALLSLFDSYNNATASKKAGEISNFYYAGVGSYVAAMNGQTLYAVGKLAGGSVYEENVDRFKHHRAVDWIYVAEEPIKLPVFEGKLTSFVLLKNPENMMLLHRLIYQKDSVIITDKPEVKDNEWWPSIDEYDPGITTDDWLEILDNPKIIGPIWGGALAAFYLHGPATCTEIGQIYNRPASAVIGNCTQLAKTVQKETNCPIFDNGERQRYYTILFVGKPAEKEQPGHYIWKLRPELEEALRQFGIERFEWSKKKVNPHTGYISNFSRGRILFGAPGTGKSYRLNRDKEALLANGGMYERVTFHPDYTYAQFAGTYKPVPCITSDGTETITYKYVPGPFMRVYAEAMRNSTEDTIKPHLLIIEEINRANVAAVFGDIFQLLDRDDDSVSEYSIHATEDMKRYLADTLGGEPDDYRELRLPDNMFIWATMNSADQGVFPMDTAFKRRWDFTYMGIDAGEESLVGKTVLLGNGDHERTIEWNALRKGINARLSHLRVNEDKLLGPYFLSKKIFNADGLIDRDKFIDAFENKVLMYLFEDAAKQRRAQLFAENVDTSRYSAICDAFRMYGVEVFCSDIAGSLLSGEPDL